MSNITLGSTTMTKQEAIDFFERRKEMCIHDRVQEAENIAIECIEKQMPKKPPKQDKTVCPTCNSKARFGNPYEYYCCHCGQAIDWSDNE